jgi:hypothetical protein
VVKLNSVAIPFIYRKDFMMPSVLHVCSLFLKEIKLNFA